MKKEDIKKVLMSHLKDAEVLLRNKRYDGAIYICGYAVELGLKYQICKRLKWLEFPPNSDFKSYKSLKTHDLDVLLSFTGKEKIIKSKYFADWSVVANWNPEARYNAIGAVAKADAQNMITSTKNLLKQL